MGGVGRCIRFYTYSYTARPNRKKQKRDAHRDTHAARERGRTSRTQTDTIHGTLPLTTSTSHPRPGQRGADSGHASDHIILSTVAKTLRLERLPTETRHASKFASTRARASRGRRGPSPRAYESSARSPHTRLSLLPPRSHARSRARRRRRGAPPPWSAPMERAHAAAKRPHPSAQTLLMHQHAFDKIWPCSDVPGGPLAVVAAAVRLRTFRPAV